MIKYTDEDIDQENLIKKLKDKKKFNNKEFDDIRFIQFIVE